MRWATLHKKIGNIPIHITNNHNVHAVLKNPATGEWTSVALTLKYDCHNRPYFIKDEKAPITTRKHPRKRG